MMQRLEIMVILVAMGCSISLAQTPEELFQQANKAYNEKKFEEARDLYQTVFARGYESGELYYNLGNAWYRTGNVARAILNYERALKRMPGDDDVVHNLTMASQMITDKIEPAPRLFIWDYWDALKGAFSLDGLTWFAYAMFVLALGSISGYLLLRTFSLRRMALLSALVFSIVCIGTTTLGVAKHADLERTDVAVIVSDITTIKNSPDANSSDAFVLHGGVKVQITDRVNQWVKVRLADGKVGWMESTAAEII